jgi:hypothetical protein
MKTSNLSLTPPTIILKNIMSELPVFKTSNEFSLHIEKIALEKKINHMDAVLWYCEQHSLEPSDVSKSINKSLKAKIENDFRELNYLPKLAQLEL